MTPEGSTILEHLAVVTAERRQREADLALGERVLAVKAYQHARFCKTYGDLLAHARYARAARFFLNDLYGPNDFSQRDEQFARIVPALVRLFPHDIVLTVLRLSELHSLSETLDSALARCLKRVPVEAVTYVRAWQCVGRPADRERQIALMLGVGSTLDGYTRNPLLCHSLRLMRGPARAAGLGALQTFLENGFETFREMRGAEFFLDTISRRERGLVAQLFAAEADELAAGPAGASTQWAQLVQLP